MASSNLLPSAPISIIAVTPPWVRENCELDSLHDRPMMNLFDALSNKTEGNRIQKFISSKVGLSYLEWMNGRLGDILNANLSSQLHKKLKHKTQFIFNEDEYIFISTCYIGSSSLVMGRRNSSTKTLPPLNFPEDDSIPDFQTLDQALEHVLVRGTIDEDGSLTFAVPRWMQFALPSIKQNELRDWYQVPLENAIQELGFTLSERGKDMSMHCGDDQANHSADRDSNEASSPCPSEGNYNDEGHSDKFQTEITRASVIVQVMGPFYRHERELTNPHNNGATKTPFVVLNLYQILSRKHNRMIKQLQEEISASVGVFLVEWFLARQVRILGKAVWIQKLEQLYHLTSIFQREDDGSDPEYSTDDAEWIIQVTCSRTPSTGAMKTQVRKGLNIPVTKATALLFNTKNKAVDSAWVKVVIDTEGCTTVEIPSWLNMTLPTFGDKVWKKIETSLENLKLTDNDGDQNVPDHAAIPAQKISAIPAITPTK